MTTLAIARERDEREPRVAVVPAELPKLTARGLDVVVESGAGELAGYPDSAYEDAGAAVAADRGTALAGAGVVAMVGPPSPEEATRIPGGCVLVTFLAPASRPDVVAALRDGWVTAFSFNLVPRTSRAQMVDALSSQAGVAGYEAVIAAAGRLRRIVPMMMTAAGTVAPARVLVIGAGVAGLQAIATARRLGASVSGYDVRPEAAEEIRSLGATAVELPLEARAGSGGYAAEQTEDFASRQRALRAGAVAAADAVITTAAVPGRPAPRILTAAMVEAMRPGAVVVDLAAGSGGNCELTVDGAEVVHGGVTVIGARDLASRAPATASALYARNVTSLLGLLVSGGQIALDFEDDIVAATCVTHAGEIRHAPTKALLEGVSG